MERTKPGGMPRRGIYLLVLLLLALRPVLAASNACASESTSVDYDRSWDSITFRYYNPGGPTSGCPESDHTGWATVADSTFGSPYTSSTIYDGSLSDDNNARIRYLCRYSNNRLRGNAVHLYEDIDPATLGTLKLLLYFEENNSPESGTVFRS